VNYQIFPRLLGIAEQGWSPKATRDPNEFTRRGAAQLANLDRFGVRYRPEATSLWTPKRRFFKALPRLTGGNASAHRPKSTQEKICIPFPEARAKLAAL
jgi:N-acetyl-beta-hexosaminidase